MDSLSLSQLKDNSVFSSAGQFATDKTIVAREKLTIVSEESTAHKQKGSQENDSFLSQTMID
jgi:hypothetical protein